MSATLAPEKPVTIFDRKSLSGFKHPTTPRQILASAGIKEVPPSAVFSADGNIVTMDEPLMPLPNEATYVSLIAGG